MGRHSKRIIRSAFGGKHDQAMASNRASEEHPISVLKHDQSSDTGGKHDSAIRRFCDSPVRTEGEEGDDDEEEGDGEEDEEAGRKGTRASGKSKGRSAKQI